MIKNFFLIVIALAVLVAIAAFMDQDIKNWILKSTGQTQSSSKVYKWRDSQGVWQISNRPPAKGTPYTEQEYLHDANVVPALPNEE